MSGLVSIIMPSYNTGKYIAESIKSVIAQTYTDWELIIVDDASTDNTDEVVKKFTELAEVNFRERHCEGLQGDAAIQKIHYFKNAHNSGAAVSRNRALREARGKWIAFLDSDDLWVPDKLEKQVSFMEKNGYAFTYTRYAEIDENGGQTGVTVGGPAHISKTGMYNYCWPGCLTVMYDREAVGDIQIADIKKNNDYAMWLKVVRKAPCHLLPETLASYRKRDGSISHGRHSEAKPKNPVTKFTRLLLLVKWHYKLYREAEMLNPVISLWITGRNLFFGVWKKFRYVKN